MAGDKAKAKKGGKAKALKGKSKKKNARGDTDGSNAAANAEAERAELLKQVYKLLEETRLEEATFNELQHQKERINYFWVVEKKKVEELGSRLRNKERELQDAQEKQQVEIKAYKLQIKKLLLQQQQEAAELKTEAEEVLRKSQDSHREKENDVKLDRRNLKIELKEAEVAHDNLVTDLKKQHDHRITVARQEFERKSTELRLFYERKSKHVREELTTKRKAEVELIERYKDEHIERLLQSHEQAFQDIKYYYSDITYNNLDLIKSLKEELTELKRKETQDSKMMSEISQENKRMSEPLHRALEDVDRLRARLVEYTKAKKKLKATKAEVQQAEHSYKKLKWAHEILRQQYDAVFADREETEVAIRNAIFELQQKTGLKSLLLDKKLQATMQATEKAQVQLTGIVRQTGSEIGEEATSSLPEVDNDRTIQSLQTELEELKGRQTQMMKKFLTKLNELGVSTAELGFDPREKLRNFKDSASVSSF